MGKLKTLALSAGLALLAAVLLAQYPAGTVYFEPGGTRVVVQSAASLDVLSGGEIDIESGGRLEFAGTAITSTAAELNILDGVTSTAAELNILDGVTATAAELDQYVIQCVIEDVSTAQSDWVVAPHAGDIVAIYSVIDAAITVADAVLSFEIGGTAVTDGGITIANAGSAAGTVDSSTPSAANALTAGEALECITDGGSTTASKAVISVVVAR